MAAAAASLLLCSHKRSFLNLWRCLHLQHKHADLAGCHGNGPFINRGQEPASIYGRRRLSDVEEFPAKQAEANFTVSRTTRSCSRERCCTCTLLENTHGPPGRSFRR